MKKMLDKMLALTAICVALSPGIRLDDQVQELMESKFLTDSADANGSYCNFRRPFEYLAPNLFLQRCRLQGPV